MVVVPLSLCAGYWISHKAIKTVYDQEDGFAESAHDIAAVKDAIYTMFEVSTFSRGRVEVLAVYDSVCSNDEIWLYDYLLFPEKWEGVGGFDNKVLNLW